ncbi:MAG TPA: cyclic peptide export ABC transporter [Clostridia bacterium]|nr:cyclic peptide export ABC transporter [Clostridia bacterium]
MMSPAADGSFYGGGWFIQDYGGGVMMHAGSNPSFSSHMVIRKGDKLGVAILTDMNSNSTSVIGQGVMEIVRGGTPGKDLPDIYRSVDSSSFAVIIIAGILILLTLFFMIHGIVQLIWGKRRFVGRRGKGWISALISLGILAAFIYCLYRMPLILFQGLSWNTVRVWGPVTFELALLMTAVEGVLFLAYYLFAASFPATEGKSLFEILMMSVFSGFGNAFLIFIINMAVSSSDDLRKNLIQYFLFAVLAYVCGQRIVRTRLVSITNDMVYTKRAELITRLLKSPFERFENIQGGRIQAGLNNDTETVSNFANAFITALTNGVTLICCFTYLGILNIWGLLVSVLIICIAMGMYTLVGMTANSLWEQTRNIQNTFFRFINDLMGGFKELRLNRKKRDEFQEDMLKACDEYRGKRKKAEYKFTNAVVLGELLFTFVIGGVAFLFPLLFKSIELSTLRSYVFVFLYMNGPIQGLLNSIPTILQMRISWKKINELIFEISGNEEDEDLKGDETSFFNLRLEGVTYSYREDKENGFSVGPVDLMCSKGQIVFITGGNGSGKSTLAKLITGLYTPTGGAVYINGIKALPEEMGGYFSTIFSDFYLFDCLYGIDYVLKGDEIKNYLKILKMEEKVEIVDGKFSTIKLSSGQRKRLALLISYLEDKPVCMFDEWAADQDPEFRKFFYYVLLPELRSRGKLIFAITHDDRYFDIADTVLKMEFGKVV